LLKASDEHEEAVAALKQCAPPAAITLAEAAESAEDPMRAVALEAIAAICNLRLDPMPNAWAQLSKDDRKATLQRLQASITDCASAWRKDNRLHAMLLAGATSRDDAADKGQKPAVKENRGE
jgi:hypothetical protein